MRVHTILRVVTCENNEVYLILSIYEVPNL